MARGREAEAEAALRSLYPQAQAAEILQQLRLEADKQDRDGGGSSKLELLRTPAIRAELTLGAKGRPWNICISSSAIIRHPSRPLESRSEQECANSRCSRRAQSTSSTSPACLCSTPCIICAGVYRYNLCF